MQPTNSLSPCSLLPLTLSWQGKAVAATKSSNGSRWRCRACLRPHSFDSLGVVRGTAEDVALADSFDKARGLFNEGMRRFNEAMGTYTCEAWFTEHFEILVDVSNLYRRVAALPLLLAVALPLHRGAWLVGGCSRGRGLRDVIAERVGGRRLLAEADSRR
jgi:hypothetical protein